MSISEIFKAVEKGDGSEVIRLLQSGAEVNQPNKNGWAPLHMAASRGHGSVVVQLLQSGAEVNQADKNGWTPLHMAVYKGCQEIKRLFMAGELKELSCFFDNCLELSTLANEYDNLGVIQWGMWLFSSKESFLIKKIDVKIQAIDALVKKYSSDPHQKIRNLLYVIRAIYNRYQEIMRAAVDNIDLSLEEKNRWLNALYTPYYRFNAQDRDLKKEAEKPLMLVEEFEKRYRKRKRDPAE